MCIDLLMYAYKNININASFCCSRSRSYPGTLESAGWITCRCGSKCIWRTSMCIKVRIITSVVVAGVTLRERE